MRFYILLVTVLLINLPAKASVGTSGGVLFTKKPGGKAAALADSFTANSGDILSVFYNPAGLGGLQIKQALFGFESGFASDSYGSLAFGMPVLNGGVAVSVAYYTAGDIELVKTNGESETVSAQKDSSVGIGYGREIKKDISAGINLKFLSSELIEKFTATAFAADIGTLWEKDNISAGLSVLNVGGKLKYRNEEDPLPLTVRAGALYRYGELAGLIDIKKVNDDSLKVSIGSEYLLHETLTLRAGYAFGRDVGALSTGFGVNYMQMSLDYGMSLESELDSIHSLSLSYSF